MIVWHVLEHSTNCLSLGAHNSHSIRMSVLGILGRMLELARHDEIEFILLSCRQSSAYIFPPQQWESSLACCRHPRAGPAMHTQQVQPLCSVCAGLHRCWMFLLGGGEDFFFFVLSSAVLLLISELIVVSGSAEPYRVWGSPIPESFAVCPEMCQRAAPGLGTLPFDLSRWWLPDGCMVAFLFQPQTDFHHLWGKTSWRRKDSLMAFDLKNEASGSGRWNSLQGRVWAMDAAGMLLPHFSSHLCSSSLLVHDPQQALKGASPLSHGFFSVPLLGLSVLNAV